MFKCASLPGKEFESKRDMFLSLKENKDKILTLKMATIRPSDPVESNHSTATKSGDFEAGFIYPVISNSNFIDSHSDMHLKGIWNKSVKEQQGKIHYTVNHELKVGSIIAYPSDVEMQLKDIPWSDFGKSYEGTTEALIFKTKISDYSNEDAAKVIKDRIPINNSVRMQYVKMQMAINSTDVEFKEEKAVWDEFYKVAVNKDTANELGHFFPVAEARIQKEGAMVVEGSNSQTPIFYPEENKSLKEMIEFSSEIANNLTKENFNYFCKQLKALDNNEPLSLTLDKVKPQEKHSFFGNMAKAAK